MVKVWPKNDHMRKLLKHPSNNIPFRESGPLDWPDDSFTHRRVKDGDVLLSDPNDQKQDATSEQKEGSRPEQRNTSSESPAPAPDSVEHDEATAHRHRSSKK